MVTMGMSNISVNSRLKQFLVLIALILGGILFALTTKTDDFKKAKPETLQTTKQAELNSPVNKAN